MPIGTSDGEYFENRFEAMVGSGVTAGLRRVPIYKDPEVSPGIDPGDDGMVVSPERFTRGRELDQTEVDPSTGMGLNVDFRMPLEASRKPAGALKQEEATTLPPRDNFDTSVKYPEPYGLNPPEGGQRAMSAIGNAVTHAVTELATLPERAIKNSEMAWQTGTYDPSVPMEAAMTAVTGGMPFAVKGAVGSAGGNLGKNKAYIDMFVDKAKTEAKPATMWEWEGFKIDTAKLSDKQHADLQKTIGYYNHGLLTKETLNSELKEYAEYTAAGGYKGKKVDPLEQVPFGYSEDEWALMSPYQKKKVLAPVDETEKILAEIAKVLDAETAQGKNWFTGDVTKIPITESGKKVSPKEDFKQKFQEAKDQLKDDLNVIAAKFKKAITGPPAEIPPPKVQGKGDYTEPAYRGLSVYDQPGMVTNPVYKFSEEGAMYSTAHPQLADMYAGYLSTHPGVKVPEGTFPPGAQVMPLLINTKDYHYFDAKGDMWQSANPKAINAAKDAGKKGVIVDNVWDEPNSTKSLAKPNKIYITFPKGAGTVKSRFAEKFDESSPNIMHGIATVGIGTAASGYIATEEQPPNL